MTLAKDLFTWYCIFYVFIILNGYAYLKVFHYIIIVWIWEDNWVDKKVLCASYTHTNTHTFTSEEYYIQYVLLTKYFA